MLVLGKSNSTTPPTSMASSTAIALSVAAAVSVVSAIESTPAKQGAAAGVAVELAGMSIKDVGAAACRAAQAAGSTAEEAQVQESQCLGIVALGILPCCIRGLGRLED